MPGGFPALVLQVGSARVGEASSCLHASVLQSCRSSCPCFCEFSGSGGTTAEAVQGSDMDASTAAGEPGAWVAARCGGDAGIICVSVWVGCCCFTGKGGIARLAESAAGVCTDACGIVAGAGIGAWNAVFGGDAGICECAGISVWNAAFGSDAGICSGAGIGAWNAAFGGDAGICWGAGIGAWNAAFGGDAGIC